MWTLLTLLSLPPAHAHQLGVWADGRAGGSAVPYGGTAQVGAGLWAGALDPRWSAGEYVALGATWRTEHAGRQALLAEARLAWQFLGGSYYVGAAVGPEWTDTARGRRALCIIGLKWVILGDYLGPALRAEAGAGDIEGWRPRGTLTFGLESVIPVLNRPTHR